MPHAIADGMHGRDKVTASPALGRLVVRRWLDVFGECRESTSNFFAAACPQVPRGRQIWTNRSLISRNVPMQISTPLSGG